MAGSGTFSYIDNTIEQINGVKSCLDSNFKKLNGMTQDVVDDIIVNEINPTINGKLAEIRQGVIDTAKEQFAQQQKLTQAIAPIADANPSDLAKVISFCMAVKDFLVLAYSAITSFITDLTLKLAELTTAITGIVNYTPPVGDISTDKLDIKMEPITIKDIVGDKK